MDAEQELESGDNIATPNDKKKKMKVKKTSAATCKSATKKTAGKVASKTTAKKCCRKATAATTEAEVKETEVTFSFHAEKGKEIYVAGEFNGWDPTTQKLVYQADEGVYLAKVALKPGDYQYKFVIDGIWCADPENANSVANDQGTFNSIVSVK